MTFRFLGGWDADDCRTFVGLTAALSVLAFDVFVLFYLIGWGMG